MAIVWLMAAGFLVTISPFMILKRRPASPEGRRMVRAAPLAWAAAILWELIAYRLGWNIRVDLLLIGAALLGVSFAALIAWLRAKPDAGEP